jgi:hypothetical protein
MNGIISEPRRGDTILAPCLQQEGARSDIFLEFVLTPKGCYYCRKMNGIIPNPEGVTFPIFPMPVFH